MLKHGDIELTQDLEPLGISVDIEKTYKQLEDRKSASGLIPLWGFVELTKTYELNPQYYVDEAILQKASEELAASMSYSISISMRLASEARIAVALVF